MIFFSLPTTSLVAAAAVVVVVVVVVVAVVVVVVDKAVVVTFRKVVFNEQSIISHVFRNAELTSITGRAERSQEPGDLDLDSPNS